jgi:glutamine synthetase adenylyltransferase
MQDGDEHELQLDLRHRPQHLHRDPLDWLAHAAGFDDGESWWNRLVEERGDSEALFESIGEVMTAAREELSKDGEHWRGEEYMKREALREAHMRQCIREAIKAGHQRIAVVCGAWHVPALKASVTAKADSALLKGLPKAKVMATWAPWTYRNLASSSGYGAGVTSPGWYQHLWQCYQSSRFGVKSASNA